MKYFLIPFLLTPIVAFSGVTATVELDPITIIAPSNEVAQFDVPYSTSVVSSKRAINQLQVKTVQDAFRYEPGVSLQQTSIGQVSPYIRGFTGYRTLLNVDGIRVNNATMREGPNQYWGTIDPLMVDSFEMIRGSNSSLYGSDAIGGTVNLYTQSWEDRPDGKNYGGRVYYRFGSADMSNIGRLEFGGKYGNWDAIVGGSGKVFQNLTTGGGQDNPNTSYDQESMNAKFRYHINDTDLITIAQQYDNQDDVWRTHSTIYGVPFKGTAVGNRLERSLDQSRLLTYGRYEGSNKGFMDKTSLTFSYQEMDEDQLDVTRTYTAETFNFKDNTFGVQARASTNTKIGVLDYGVEYYHDDVNSDGTITDPKTRRVTNKRQGTVADDSSYNQVGVYLQDTYNWKDFELTAGGRYSYSGVHLGKGFNDSTKKNVDNFNNSWSTGTGNGRLLYHLTENVNLFTGVSQGWRAPTIYNLSGVDFARSNEIQTYSLGLKPEKFITYDAGFKTQFSHFDTLATYFYTDITDMIDRAPTGQKSGNNVVVEGRNAGKGHIQGVELQGNYYFNENWRTFANYTWTEGTVLGYPGITQQTELSSISKMIPMNGTFGIHWTSDNTKFWAESTLSAVAEQSRLSVADKLDTQRIPPGGTPGYVLVGLRGGWNPIHDLRTTLAVENLTDAKYRVHGSGINGPGLQVVLSLDYRY